MRRAIALTATGIYSDSTNANLTAMVDWASSVPANATVTNTGVKGLVVGVEGRHHPHQRQDGHGQGRDRSHGHRARVDGGDRHTADRHHRAQVHPRFTATATYDDSTTLDVTHAVTWTSSMPAVATIIEHRRR